VEDSVKDRKSSESLSGASTDSRERTRGPDEGVGGRGDGEVTEEGRSEFESGESS
jgi:hypothetical protein